MNRFDRYAHNIRSSKLYKNSANGMVCGVCAGLSDWLGLKSWAVRLIAILGLIFLTGPTLIAYFVAALVLSNRPVARYDRYARAFGYDEPYRR
ncbi:PspC domain-containing protein [Niveispirillum sp. BGYR6]|uniref:PspC domain-containing protein n=1 Tax=Niveispirillum sp. BGYR6 TaxID=2971249 RepID=UPI000B636942|nr:PspC domain-containing protein [Niveispirillum sp. BGYR6]SNR97741.1 phage shock protein C (PspC) family protein [Azospirillum sp. RU38E]SNS14882.1 phage shock protein C (PspC) family protein [Azospirillum sp. RU37A]